MLTQGGDVDLASIENAVEASGVEANALLGEATEALNPQQALLTASDTVASQQASIENAVEASGVEANALLGEATEALNPQQALLTASDTVASQQEFLSAVAGDVASQGQALVNAGAASIASQGQDLLAASSDLALHGQTLLNDGVAELTSQGQELLHDGSAELVSQGHALFRDGATDLVLQGQALLDTGSEGLASQAQALLTAGTFASQGQALLSETINQGVDPNDVLARYGQAALDAAGSDGLVDQFNQAAQVTQDGRSFLSNARTAIGSMFGSSAANPQSALSQAGDMGATMLSSIVPHAGSNTISAIQGLTVPGIVSKFGAVQLPGLVEDFVANPPQPPVDPFNTSVLSFASKMKSALENDEDIVEPEEEGKDGAEDVYDPKLLIGEIKAKTMHRMVQEILTDSGTKRVLYIPNDHCKMLSKDMDLAEKIEEHFEIAKPQLVIQLLLSNGDTAWVDDSKKAYPNIKPLVVTDVYVDGEKSYFTFDKSTVAACLHVSSVNNKIFRVRKVSGKETMEGSIKCFESEENGCYGRWDPLDKAGPQDLREGDTLELTKSTKMTPYANYPWKDRRESMQADQRVVTFMQDVIIPLAANTNAIVLCSAHSPDCMLSNCFSKALQMKRHTWPGKPPFTVIGTTDTQWLYTGSKNKFWRQLQKKIPSWEGMEPRYQKLFPEYCPTDRDCDLDKGLDNFIVNDRLEKNDKDPLNSMPFMTFQNELIRQWMNRVPAFSMTSGFSFNFSRILAPIQGGSPVVFLDAREREIPKTVDDAFTQHNQFRKDLIDSSKTADFLTNETLAYFHLALTNEEQAQAATEYTDEAEAQMSRPLWMQIEEKAKRSLDHGSEQKEFTIERIASHIINANFEDQFQILPDRERREAKGENAETFSMELRLDKIREFVVALGHSKMYSCSCYDVREAKKIINSLTKVDRVPSSESLDGLILLREAWDQYDIKMYLANWYKAFAKILFAILLILGVLSVVLTIVQGNMLEKPERRAQRQELCDSYRNKTSQMTQGVQGGNAISSVIGDLCESGISLEEFDPDWLSLAVLMVSVLSTVGVSVEGYVRAAGRWRTLRTAALSLESMIWMYRTRVGPFADSVKREPQLIFCDMLTDWTNFLSAGAELSNTSLEKKYNPKIFKHYQRSGGLHLKEDDDDFHSPMNSQRYIDCRLAPRREFYERRVPTYVRNRTLCQIATFVCSAVSAVLSYMNYLPWVGIVSAVAAAITSWMGFTDLSRKSERYTNAITGIKELERKWATLTPVQRSDRKNMMELVTKGEQVLTSEYSTWSSSIGRAEKKKDGAEKNAGQGNGSASVK